SRDESRPLAGQWMRRRIGGIDDGLVRRTVAALGVELADAPLVDMAFSAADDTFKPEERATVAALLRLPLPQTEMELDAIAEAEGMAPLAAAIAGLVVPATRREARARAFRTTGREASKRKA